MATLAPQNAPKRRSKMDQKLKGAKKCHVRFRLHETPPDGAPSGPFSSQNPLQNQVSKNTPKKRVFSRRKRPKAGFAPKRAPKTVKVFRARPFFFRFCCPGRPKTPQRRSWTPPGQPQSSQCPPKSTILPPFFTSNLPGRARAPQKNGGRFVLATTTTSAAFCRHSTQDLLQALYQALRAPGKKGEHSAL